MNNNKKGLSTIVATLLIILLTLVAVGIIWVVVRNVVQGGSEQVDIDAKCLQANVVATNVVAIDDAGVTESFDVTLSRQGGGDEIGGVRLVFMNDSESSSSVANIVENIAPLRTITRTAIARTADEVTAGTGLANASKVSVVVYFLDTSGNEQLCSSNSNPFEF